LLPVEEEEGQRAGGRFEMAVVLRALAGTLPRARLAVTYLPRVDMQFCTSEKKNKRVLVKRA
jgi:hypothetical protein